MGGINETGKLYTLVKKMLPHLLKKETGQINGHLESQIVWFYPCTKNLISTRDRVTSAAILWKNWYNCQYGLKDYKMADIYRKQWGKCVEEHTKMCDHELKRNPQYTKMKPLFDEP